MNISQRGIDLIIEFEGLKLKAYKDSKGLLTIGVGHLLTTQELTTGIIEVSRFKNSIVKVEWTKGITKLEAMDILTEDVQIAVKAINQNVTINLKQHEFDVLTSFIFNIGIGAFQKSSLLKFLNSNNKLAAADQLTRWVKAGGKVIKGLVNRRNKEKYIFLNGYK